MERTIVHPPKQGGKRVKLECPHCGSNSLKKLSQSEVFLLGEWPAPKVEVRLCNRCGELSERDRWIEERAIWRGFA